MNETKKREVGGFLFYFPPAAIAFTAFFAVALVVRIVGASSTAVADAVTSTVGAAFRAAMATVTGWFSFSLAEMLLLLSPVFLGLFIWLVVARAKKGIEYLLRLLIIVLSILLLILGTFFTAVGVSYGCTRPEEKMELDTGSLVQNDYYEAARILLTEIAAVQSEIKYDETGASVMPYSMEKLSEKLCDAYDRMNADLHLTQTIRARAKSILLSEPMMYTHLSGIYSYFTGEANLNVNYPDYIVVSSAAHEFAHQRGIAPEDEASFVALIACLYSDDPYIRYSGCLDIYGTVSSELRKASPELYKKLTSEYLTNEVIGELNAYYVMFQKYADNSVAKVSDKVNDAYLKSQGQQAGTKSYDMVFSLAVAYLVRSYNK